MNLKAINLFAMLTFLVMPFLSLAATKPTLLKIQSAARHNTPAIKYVHDSLMKAKAVTGGSLNVRWYDPGKLVPVLQILDAVTTGKIDAGLTTPHFHAGKISALSIFTGPPFGPESVEFITWAKFGGGAKLLQETYDQSGFKVHTIYPCGVFPADASGWFKKEIRKPADLKGLKLRYGGLGGEVMKALGVSTALLSPPAMYNALDSGVIDGLELAGPGSDLKYGFYKVAKNYYFPSWHARATNLELLINKNKWNSLSKDQQQTLELLCDAASIRTLTYLQSLQPAALVKFKTEGVKFHYWDKTMLKSFKTAYEKVIKKKTANDPTFKKVWDSLNSFQKNNQLWKELEFLPQVPYNEKPAKGP